ncbi:hypothetical protein JXB28_01955 [Candidatus Woesearchaeota archaeon]|nr:hypothetical protein [Candidatus Woesearchaeota archaeon]
MVSNKNLALLLIVAVVISLGGTLMSLNKIGQIEELRKLPLPVRQTGMAAYVGNVSLTITSNASCVVSNNVSFGTAGQPSDSVNISTNADNTGEGFSDCTLANCTGIEINNNGNVNLLVNFTSNVNATGLLVSQSDLTDNDFMYKVKNGTDAAARPGCIEYDLPEWSSINNSESGEASYICGNLTSGDTADTVTMEFNVTLEPDVVAGTKTAILTINCIQN